MKELLLKGSQKIMLSAPHCVDHYRNGKIKIKEINTDEIVKELNKRIDIPGIYKLESNGEDANWDLDSPYKEACKEYIINNEIKFLIDIHGMDNRRREDICIGTAKGKNIKNYKIVEEVKEIFEEFGYKNVTIDRPFSANNIRCVSRYINKECNIDTLQIEINNKYKFPKSEEYDLEKLIDCFDNIIKTITSSFDNL